MNLIANAEQALDGRRSGRIIIAVVRDGAFARLAVSDDGPGLPDQMATQAFDAFVTTKPRPDSVGLGLPVARAIAETHDGHVVSGALRHGRNVRASNSASLAAGSRKPEVRAEQEPEFTPLPVRG